VCSTVTGLIERHLPVVPNTIKWTDIEFALPPAFSVLFIAISLWQVGKTLFRILTYLSSINIIILILPWFLAISALGKFLISAAFLLPSCLLQVPSHLGSR
jgi:hypothetical protein